ncbi:SusC/RagA family TonB-linked outer membrane protein [Gelidibacter salicanalis]|uniref:TonB-dependent receptor n=1 Tax=Gelidibacter salicanalis TaxID=291193 RepID=A0A934KTK8_9FLAO|nr:TonB-dependent receptor [Gelidibacter salicanalis]MBJ7881126.1 TonB-dependent receptor [Gelidibacter salicanalis]
MKARLVLFLFFLFSYAVSQAQESTVTGTVTNAEDNMPVPGVNVLIKGTTRGTSTDFDGKYSITAKSDEILEFSYVGFKKQSFTVGSQTVVNVTLQNDIESLSEIVVIGYGTQKRSEVTGAISSIKSEELLKQPALNATQSIQGKLSGVNIVNSDAPGAVPKVVIRGVGTASAGEQVLYIVDGIQVTGITNINPADIETMDVLKDASSTAIYGMDAANGVVIITTKKGKKGQTKIELSSFYGAKTILNQVRMADANQYVTYFNENQTAIGGDNSYQLAPASQQPANTDWYDALIDVGFSNSNNVALSGAGDMSSYYFSFNNYNEDGILKDQDLSRNTLRLNNTFNFFDNKLKITSSISGAFTKSTPKPFGAFNEAYRQAPIVPVFYPDGHFGTNDVNRTTGVQGFLAGLGETIGGLNSVGNPVANVFFSNNKNKATDLQGIIEAELKITDFLKFTSRVGMTKAYGRERVFNDIRGRYVVAGDPVSDTDQQFQNLQDANPNNTQYANNSLRYTMTENFSYNWDNFLSFDKTFNEKHTIGALAGITKGKRDDFYFAETTAYGVPSQEQYWSIEFANGNYDNVSTQRFSTYTTQLSYFGRLQYNYDGKYLAQVNIRRDGVSTFKDNAEYFGNFPSFSLGWVLTEENFLKDVNGLDFLKLRGGWGEVGNSRVPFNQFRFNTNSGSNNVNYVFGVNQDFVLGASLGAQVFPISWEVTEETNIGLEFRMLDSRLAGSVDLYDRRTNDAILQVRPVLNSPNDANFFDSGADITNKGVEVELNWRDDINDNLSYNIGVVYSYNKNNVENVKPAYDGQIGGSLNNGQITKRLQDGQPLYAWWMYEAEGVWQNQAEIDNNPRVGSPKPGHLRYKDQNDDGVIDDRDKKFFGSYLPTYNLGLTLGLNYKNIDFSVDAFGAGGNKIYNGLKGTRIDGGENITADVFNERWTGEGSTNVNPGANRDAIASSYYLEDGDYLRINNMTLGYTLKNVIPDISRIRLYLTVQNPFLFTNYSGFTPELVGNEDGAPEERAGIELSAYPNTKTFLFGVNIEL